jgi:N-acetylglutamate synthase-like GNAT family acetyltransferase
MIGKACAGDVQEILAVINASNREAFKKVIPPPHFREPVLSREQLLDDFERMTFYVYRQGGKIVGVVALHVQSAEMGRIRWVYILPGHQRRGVGTALVTFLEGQAREMGFSRLRLLTTAKARWAVNFYKKLGFRLTEKIERPWGFDVIMEKRLT